MTVDPGFAPPPEVRRDLSRIVLTRDGLFADDYEPPIPAVNPPAPIFADGS